MVALARVPRPLPQETAGDPQFAADAQSNEVKAKIMAEGDAGVSRGVRNTPTIFINGNQTVGRFDEAALRTAIDAAIAGKKKAS